MNADQQLGFDEFKKWGTGINPFNLVGRQVDDQINAQGGIVKQLWDAFKPYDPTTGLLAFIVIKMSSLGMTIIV